MQDSIAEDEPNEPIKFDSSSRSGWQFEEFDAITARIAVDEHRLSGNKRQWARTLGQIQEIIARRLALIARSSHSDLILRAVPSVSSVSCPSLETN